MGKGGKCFMAYRQFGEHGGMPNKEHRSAPTGILIRLPLVSRLGIGLNHHADVLRAPLKFLPAYATGSRLRYWRKRAEGRTLGFLRLVAGRTVAPLNPMSGAARLRLYGTALVRLLG
jgi:hypothetical protein